MAEDNNFIPDDSELEFIKQEQDIALFNQGYDEPIDNKFLHNYIGGRQMGYGDDELKIIEDTAFSKIMDYMDANDIHYSDIDVYDFIPEDKRLTPYLIFELGQRNEYYTNDLVEYMISVTRRTPSGIYDFDLDEIIDAPPSHYMAEYALKGADAQGPEQKLITQAKIISGEFTEGDLKKLKFKEFFEKVSITANAKDVKIKFVNNLFPGGSYEAYLEEGQRRAMEKMGMTPEGDWLPEVKENMIIKHTDVDGKVTYKDFYGKEVSPDDPRISDDSKFDDLVKDLQTPPEELTEEQQIKKLYDDGIITETEYKQALNKEGNWADTPTNVVDDLARQVDIQDVRIFFNEAYSKFDGQYMTYDFFEDFLINQKNLSEDVSKQIISDIKTGLTKPEFPNIPDSVFNPEFFPEAGTNFDTAISRSMFNSPQVQNQISEKYAIQDVEDYLNLPLEKQNQLAKNFYEGINPNTTGKVEFYVQQQSPNKLFAKDIKLGLDIKHQIPGFYTEPIGNRDLSSIRGQGSNAPINNYYKVQANTDNFLIDIAPGRFAGTGGNSPLINEGRNELGRQINKIDWETFTKLTGATYEMLGNNAKIINGQKYYSGSVQDFSSALGRLDTTVNVTEALRKSGIEGFVSGPTNVQYEVVLLDPNDNLGIGKKVNIEDTTIQEFQANQAKVNQLDELIIDTPTNVVDDVVMNKSEAIDNIDNLIDELPLEEAFKKQVKKNTARIGKNIATPGGIIDFIDAWELGVLALGVTAIATGEIDEIPTIMYNQGVKMYNNMLSSVGLPVQVEEKPYNINFEKAINTFNIAEMFMPTAYVEKAAVKEFKKGQEAGIDISVGLGAGVGVPPMQFKTDQPKEDTGNINNIMTNLMSNISNAQKSYPITADEIGTFGRNPINVVPEDTKDKPVKVEYDSKEKQNLHDIYANLYTKLSNASARVE